MKYPSFSCGKCECNTPRKNAKMMEDEKANKFLMGLDDELYSTLRGQILALDSLPSLEKIFNIVRQEENHKKVMRSRDS